MSAAYSFNLTNALNSWQMASYYKTGISLCVSGCNEGFRERRRTWIELPDVWSQNTEHAICGGRARLSLSGSRIRKLVEEANTKSYDSKWCRINLIQDTTLSLSISSRSNLILSCKLLFSSFQVDTCKISTPELCTHILFPEYELCTQSSSPWFNYSDNRPDAYIKFAIT